MFHVANHDKHVYFALIKDWLLQSGIHSVFRLDDRAMWQDVYQSLDYQYIGYSNLDIDYYYEIEASINPGCIDTSFLLLENGKPTAIFPLSVSPSNTDTPLSSHGNLILAPEFVTGTPLKQKTRVSKICYKLILFLAKYLGQNSVSSLCRNQAGINITSWHLAAILSGASCNLKYEAYIDLSNSIDQIRRGFRKSYKPLINSSLNLWKTFVVQPPDIPHEFERFQELHFKAAGRRTRSSKSWLLQQEALLSGSAFLVMQHDKQNQVVGGALFLLTRDEAYYGVSAFDRSLFDKPVAHGVQLIAIQEMIRRGISYYRIGDCHFDSASCNVSAKELSISLFKRGFTNTYLCNYVLCSLVD